MPWVIALAQKHSDVQRWFTGTAADRWIGGLTAQHRNAAKYSTEVGAQEHAAKLPAHSWGRWAVQAVPTCFRVEMLGITSYFIANTRDVTVAKLRAALGGDPPAGVKVEYTPLAELPDGATVIV